MTPSRYLINDCPLGYALGCYKRYLLGTKIRELQLKFFFFFFGGGCRSSKITQFSFSWSILILIKVACATLTFWLNAAKVSLPNIFSALRFESLGHILIWWCIYIEEEWMDAWRWTSDPEGIMWYCVPWKAWGMLLLGLPHGMLVACLWLTPCKGETRSWCSCFPSGTKTKVHIGFHE